MTTPAKRGRPAGRTHTVAIRVHMTPEQHARYTAAALDMGVAMSEWAREAMDAFASDDPSVHPIARKHGFR